MFTCVHVTVAGRGEFWGHFTGDVHVALETKSVIET